MYCLRNDIGQNVVWYNATLMKKFGYQVPTTWEQYQALGAEVAKQHPGYIIGSVGDPWTPEVYFWASQCPANQITGNNGLGRHRQPELHEDGQACSTPGWPTSRSPPSRPSPTRSSSSTRPRR